MPTQAAALTPVRALGKPDKAGFRMLRDVELKYRDGGEQRVLELIAAATDLHSTSDELITSATTWAERYHLHPARANVLRSIDLPPKARVLEVGAGCGAITRYLGESCALVDALEPVPSRAAAAASRTRDLDGVEVIVGALEDVPAEPTYDVIVVVGVLEYVGAGTADREPYRTFLDQVHARLVDGGTLVLAIENRLGVKYLVGSPEDHTGRFFDSVEGYPVGGNARTFTRPELEGLVSESGLQPNTFIAFPDYKMTRVVLSEMPPGAESLLYRIPRMPSPDWTKARPRLAHEGRVWRSLVEGGLGSEFGNSFLVLAGKGKASDFWPANQLGAFYTPNRRPALSTRTVVESGSDGVQFDRRGLVPGPHEVGSIRLVESVSAFQPGRDVLEVIAEGGLSAAEPLIAGWLDLLRDAVATHELVPMDLVPHNLVLDDSGGLHVIDIELFDEGLTLDAVVRRGVLWFADRVTKVAPPERWAPHTTVGEVMIELGTLAGLPSDGSWIDQAIVEEAGVAMLVHHGPLTGLTMQEWRANLEAEFRKIPKRRLDASPVGERLWEKHKRTATSATEASKRVKKLEAELARVRGELTKSKTQLKALQAASLKGRVRRTGGKLLPRGTRRRALASRVISRIR